MLAHIAGMPIEETVMGFSPVVGLGLAYIFVSGRRRLSSLSGPSRDSRRRSKAAVR